MNPDSERAFLDGLSPTACASLAEALTRPRATPPAPADLAGWAALQKDVERRSLPACEHAIEQFGPRLSEHRFATLDALLIEPQSAPSGRPPLIFLHGGGYTAYSARSSLFASVPLAADLRRTVIALDYPLAPAATYATTVPATARALDAVLREFPGAALVGDSAGGGLAVAACNELMRSTQSRVAALVLISPWTDLGNRGDSRLTLCDHDPLLQYEPGLAGCAAAYAPEAVDAPEASPVLANYDTDFPPTLLVCGSREILLSDSVRLYRRLRAAGVRAVLDVHDGLHHSFPIVTPFAPEAQAARATIRDFLESSPGLTQ